MDLKHWVHHGHTLGRAARERRPHTGRYGGEGEEERVPATEPQIQGCQGEIYPEAFHLCEPSELCSVGQALGGGFADTCTEGVLTTPPGALSPPRPPCPPRLGRPSAEVEGTHIGLEGRLQHAGSQPLEVQLLEEGVFLHLTGTTSTTPQALSRVLAQELQQGRGGQGGAGEVPAAPRPGRSAS